MNKNLFILILPIIVGCTTNNDPVEVVQPTIELTEAEQINSWIYAQMNHYYLWRDDLPDSLNCDFTSTPKDFYKSLLSSKDRFSYLTANSSNRASECDVTEELGFQYQLYLTNDGTKVYNVLYTTTRAAKKAGIKRGDLLILESNNTNSISVLRVKPDRLGGIAIDKRITYSRISSRTAKNETVYIDSIYTISNSKIGYMCYLQYDSPEDFCETINTFANSGITDMILDLRYNPGGLINTCKKLCNLIVSSEAYGQVFQQQSFNDILSADNLNRTGNERTFTYYTAPAEGATLGLKYEYLNLNRVFILTSKGTASASESTIICLKPYINVITIGEQTTGKGVGMWTLSSSKYRYALVPITFRYYNAANETVPEEGLTPDYYVPDGYSTRKSELGDVNEPLLNQALRIICPNDFVSQTEKRMSDINNYDIYLTPIGEPSYITEFKQKRFQYEN